MYGPYGRLQQSFHYDDYLKGGGQSGTQQFHDIKGKEFKGVRDYLKDAVAKHLYGVEKYSDLGGDRRSLNVGFDVNVLMQKDKLSEQIVTTKEKYDTALRKVTFYDEWGQPVDTQKFW